MRRIRWILVVALFATLVVSLHGARAEPPLDENSPPGVQSPQLSNFVNIWTDQANSTGPAVAYNSRHDEYLVVWENRHTPTTMDIYARRVGSDGSLRSWFAIDHVPGKWHRNPAVAYSPEHDEYLVVYEYEFSTDDWDIHAKRVAWNGSWMSAVFPVNQGGGKQWGPAVAYNSQDGEYLVAYFNSWPGGLNDIAAQRVRASDGWLLSWRNIATGPGESRHSPDVAYNAARNQYLVVYEYGTGTDIYGKLTSANMDWLSGEFDFATTSGDEYYPAVAAGVDEYLVTWGGRQNHVWGRKVSGDGGLQANDLMIGPPIGGVNSFLPDVAYSPGCGYLVTWEVRGGVSSYDNVYARHVMPREMGHMNEPFPIDDSAEEQARSAVACAPYGDCLVVEQDMWAGNDDIRGRFVRFYRTRLPLIMRHGP